MCLVVNKLLREPLTLRLPAAPAQRETSTRSQLQGRRTLTPLETRIQEGMARLLPLRAWVQALQEPVHMPWNTSGTDLKLVIFVQTNPTQGLKAQRSLPLVLRRCLSARRLLLPTLRARPPKDLGIRQQPPRPMTVTLDVMLLWLVRQGLVQALTVRTNMKSIVPKKSLRQAVMSL